MNHAYKRAHSHNRIIKFELRVAYQTKPIKQKQSCQEKKAPKKKQALFFYFFIKK